MWDGGIYYSDRTVLTGYVVSAVCLYVGGGIYPHSDRTVLTGPYGQCCVFSMWVVGSNIEIGHSTDHMSSAVCISMWVVGSNIVIDVLTGHMVSAVSYLYVGGGI